jgi:hypothetical protein
MLPKSVAIITTLITLLLLATSTFIFMAELVDHFYTQPNYLVSWKYYFIWDDHMVKKQKISSQGLLGCDCV